MPKKLLLADDSITIQKVIGITFANEDFALTTVDNGTDAIATARQLKPDLILADVVMPGKNGYEVCEYVKHDPELRHTPVLLLAGTFESFDEAEMVRVGADGYITKPFESQTLIDKVHELISRATAAEPAAPAPEPAPAEGAEEFNLDDFSPFEEVAGAQAEEPGGGAWEADRGSGEEDVWDLSDFEPHRPEVPDAGGDGGGEYDASLAAAPGPDGDPEGAGDPARLEDEPLLLGGEGEAPAGWEAAAPVGEQVFDFGELDATDAGPDAGGSGGAEAGGWDQDAPEASWDATAAEEPAGAGLEAAGEADFGVEGEQTFGLAEPEQALEYGEAAAGDGGVWAGEAAAAPAPGGPAEGLEQTDDVLELTEFEEVTETDEAAPAAGPLAADLVPEEEAADAALVSPEGADGWEVAALGEVRPPGGEARAAGGGGAGAGGDPEPAAQPARAGYARGLAARIRDAAEELAGDSPGTGSLAGLAPEQVEAIVTRVAREVIEEVAWEVVPDLCEALIKEEIRKLTGR